MRKKHRWRSPICCYPFPNMCKSPGWTKLKLGVRSSSGPSAWIARSRILAAGSAAPERVRRRGRNWQQNWDSAPAPIIVRSAEPQSPWKGRSLVYQTWPSESQEAAGKEVSCQVRIVPFPVSCEIHSPGNALKTMCYTCYVSELNDMRTLLPYNC